MLTQPKEPHGNEGLDNAEANLICSVGDALVATGSGGSSASGGGGAGATTFTILDLLGQGTFGQVFKCQRAAAPQGGGSGGRAGGTTSSTVAVKVVKNKPVSCWFWGGGE